MLLSRIVNNILDDSLHFQKTLKLKVAKKLEFANQIRESVAENKIDWACNGDWLDHDTTVNQSDLTEFEDTNIASLIRLMTETRMILPLPVSSMIVDNMVLTGENWPKG